MALVLLVDAGMSLPKNILVPTQLDAMSEIAIDQAFVLAKKFGANVKLLHVFRPPALDLPEGMLVGMADATDHVLRAAEKALEGALEKRRSSSPVPVDASWHVEIGEPWRRIVEYARTLEDPWILMPTHGRRGLERALLGSVAEKVVRLAPCAVLTIPGPRG